MPIIVGIVLILGCCAAGFLLSGGHLMALFQPYELLIIGGSAIGAMFISNPMSITLKTLTSIGSLFKASPFNKAFYVDSLSLMYEIFNKMRKQGFIAIEGDVEDPASSAIFSKYPMILKDHHIMDFITDYLRIMVTGTMTAHDLEALIDMEMETHHQEAGLIPGAMTKLSDGLPGFGIVAAVMGVVITMGHIGGPPQELGHHVGAALVGTFLGILLAYGFFGPFASALEHKVREESRFYEVLKICLVATVRGTAPKIAVEFSRKAIYHSVRPTFQELEDRLKELK
jgi:chemotaxis protein MotA